MQMLDQSFDDRTAFRTSAVGEVPVRTKPIITAERVRKEFGAGSLIALDDVDLVIDDNELFTLLGPSGCGKTTLLRIFAGFEHPTRGRVLLEGRDIADAPPFRRPVNTMFQSYALFPHLSVARNVAFGLEMLGWKKREIKARVAEMLDLVQLSDLGDRRPSQLSGGQQQRIALARALAPKPRVLLLDEPLSALDLKLRRAMQVELKRLQRETAVTFVMVTHDQEEALALSDRIAVMNKGLVLQVGTPTEIYDNPRTCFVADFIGEANLIPARMLGEASDCTYSVRPESVRVERAPSEAVHSLAGHVSSVTYLGADTLVEAKVDAGRPIRARLRGGRGDLASGDAVYLCWDRRDERKLLA